MSLILLTRPSARSTRRGSSPRPGGCHRQRRADRRRPQGSRRRVEAHGLIKVRVFSDDREAREAMFRELADTLDAAPIQHIGKLLVLWRPVPPKEQTERDDRMPGRAWSRSSSSARAATTGHRSRRSRSGATSASLPAVTSAGQEAHHQRQEVGDLIGAPDTLRRSARP